MKLRHANNGAVVILKFIFSMIGFLLLFYVAIILVYMLYVRITGYKVKEGYATTQPQLNYCEQLKSSKWENNSANCTSAYIIDVGNNLCTWNSANSTCNSFTDSATTNPSSTYDPTVPTSTDTISTTIPEPTDIDTDSTPSTLPASTTTDSTPSATTATTSTEWKDNLKEQHNSRIQNHIIWL
jgi:hypothetical protein